MPTWTLPSSALVAQTHVSYLLSGDYQSQLRLSPIVQRHEAAFSATPPGKIAAWFLSAFAALPSKRCNMGCRNACGPQHSCPRRGTGAPAGTGGVYTTAQVREFYEQRGNRYNCHCSQTECLLNSDGRSIFTERLKAAMTKEWMSAL